MWIMAVPVYANDLVKAGVKNVTQKTGKWSIITESTYGSLEQVRMFVMGQFGLDASVIIKK